MRWRVTTLHGRATSGRARPPKVELVGDGGEKIEAYLKSPQLHPAKSCYCLEREWIATRLAQELGLPCAKVVPIEVTNQLIQMASKISDESSTITSDGASLDQMLRDGPGLLGGSVLLGSGWSEWSQASALTKKQLNSASEIYFFDTMVQNWDRVRPNPNLLIKNNSYGMIDHEESFVEAAGLDEEKDLTPKPWREGGVINDCGEIDEHPLWQGIKRFKGASFGVIVKRWKSLPEARIRGFAKDAVFDDWSRNIADKITDYLLDAIENIDDVQKQIEENRSE